MFTNSSNWSPREDQLKDEARNVIDRIRICTAETIDNIENNDKYKIINRKIDAFPARYEKMIRLNDADNLTREERDSLLALGRNRELLIKPADKGGATVLMNKENYIREAERQLKNDKYYKKLEVPIYTENVPRIQRILSEMLEQEFISKDQYAYLTGPTEIKNRTFYLLPKIHKKPETWPQPGKMPEGRPIVSDVNSETYRISELIDHYINPLATKHETYIKNTYDFIEKVRNYAVENNYLLVTGDVTALYTNMNIDRSIECVRKAFNENKQINRPDKHILDLLEISMKYNDFEFAGNFYLQTMGTAMGKRFAPGLANLYLLEFDRMAKNGFRMKPLLFFRYLDDIFFLWPGDVTSLKEFEVYLNSIIPDIKVTLEYSQKEINFLDTTIFIADSKLQTKVFFKPTDTHQLLHKSSFHPKHTFKGLLKSQIIRFKRICSFKSDFDDTCKILFAVLKHRGYGLREMRTTKNDIWFNYCEKTKSTEQDQLIPIILDFCSVGQQLGRNFKDLLGKEKCFKDQKLVLAFKNSKNIRQLLVRSKLETCKQGAFRTCGQHNCKTCRVHATDSIKIQSYNFKQDFNITDNITCSSSNLIYLITCRKCCLQYVGETGRTLRDRLNDHRSAIKQHKNTPIGLHFNTTNHSILDLKIVGIELNKDNNETHRKNREKFWQKTLGTCYPKGLNGLPT